MSVIEKELDHGNDIGWANGKNLDQKLDRLDVIKKQLNDVHRVSAAIPELLTAWEKLQEKFKTAVRICSTEESTGDVKSGGKTGTTILVSYLILTNYISILENIC